MFQLSSNINEVIWTVLNSLFSAFLFYKKIPHAPKSTKKHQKHKNATKQKHKTQISKQNQITRLKTSEWKKVTYSCFFVRAKKRK